MLALEHSSRAATVLADGGYFFGDLGLTADERQALVVRLAAEQLPVLDLAEILGQFSEDERERIVAALVNAGFDVTRLADATRVLEAREALNRRRGFQAVLWSLALASGAVSAVHGYRRNRKVGWAVWWFAMGTIFPLITPAIAFAQGFAQPRSA